MKNARSSFFPPFLMLVGTIIGAGVFGVPAVFAEMGLFTGTFVFWGVALLVLCAHLLFIEVISRDTRRRRLPGYVGNVLGIWAERVGIAMHSLHLLGANLAYLILGGQFLGVILAGAFPNVDVFFWQLSFWVFGLLTITSGLNLLSKIESFLAWGLLAVMGVMVCLAAGAIRFPLPSLFGLGSVASGLGIFVFSLSGLTVMPEVYELSKKNIRRTRFVSVSASFLTAFLTYAFGVTMYLAANGKVLLQSPADLNAIFPAGLGWLLPVFGFLAVATSFLATGFDLASMFQFDMKLSRRMSLVLTLGIPFFLLLVTSRNFFATIDVVGAVFSGSSALLVVASAGVAMQTGANRPPFWWRTLVPAAATMLFAFVILYRILPWGVH